MALSGARWLLLVSVLAACGEEPSPAQLPVQVLTASDVAPAWTIPYGAEPWHLQPGTIDVAAMIDRANHALSAVGGGAHVRSASYEATFDGLTASLTTATATARIHTSRIAFPALRM